MGAMKFAGAVRATAAGKVAACVAAAVLALPLFAASASAADDSAPQVVPATATSASKALAPPPRPELVRAIERGDVSAALALLNAGANVRDKDADGTTALHWA